jgi:hypothetical protein
MRPPATPSAVSTATVNIEGHPAPDHGPIIPFVADEATPPVMALRPRRFSDREERIFGRWSQPRN